MIEMIDKIMSENLFIVNKKKESITFEIDHEGKSLLNKEVSKLYKKNSHLTESELVDIIINSKIIIDKMSKLKICGWKISELKAQLDSGIANYQNNNDKGVSTINSSSSKSKLLNSTAIGEYFNVSSQRINLILSELGWIEKAVAGWTVTKLGRSIGGIEKEHETSGNLYVRWPETVLTNKSLLEVFNATQQWQSVKVQEKEEATPSTISIPTPTVYHDTFREKYPASQRTLDGHYVRSKSEMLIDNFLYINGIVHAYERKLPIEEDVYCDFYIPSGNGRPQAVYIEFWGLENDQKYLERKKKKIEIYEKYEFPLIQLQDQEINNLEEILTKKLIQHKIKVG